MTPTKLINTAPPMLTTDAHTGEFMKLDTSTPFLVG